VTVNSTDADPVHVHVSEIGTSGVLAVPYMPIGGNVIVTTIPPITGNVNASVNGTVGIAGNIAGITALPPITGNVNASVTGNVVITGNIAGITALPPITGNVNAAVSGTVGIAGNIAGITALPPITGTVGISGNIAGITALPPITGNVNANVTGNVGITGNVNVTQGTTPWTIAGNVNAAISGMPTVTFSSESTDAFGRLRVSTPYTLFDTNQRYYDHQQFSSAITGSANAVFQSSSSTFQLNVGSGAGDSIIRETMRVFPYQPGKSLLVLATFCGAALKPNLRQRVGFFGADNGIYFEIVGTTLNMVIRSSSSGVIVEDRIPQTQWNGDRLDGTGGTTNPSGITLNPTLDQIWWTDIEWLGVGTVRVGFIINGIFYTCHSFNHANTPSTATANNTTTYMGTATLPVRYELTNLAATSGSSMMRQICVSVNSEGGYNSFGTTETAGTGTTTKRLTTSGVYYPIVSIRMAAGRLDSIVVPRQIDVLSPTVNYYRWVLLKNPTLTGATWTGTSSTGSVQYDLGATALSGGTEIQSGYASSRELLQLSATDFFQFQLGRTLAGVSDVVTLALAATSNNADVLAELGWQELT
jgi:hypothetical protein